MAASVHLAIRALHVIGMALLLGGAAGAWFVVREDLADPLGVALRYEWLFWGAFGVMVVTGVGNLAAVGAPGPATDWGRVFLVKILVVLAFVVGSLLRTLAVVRVKNDGGSREGMGRWTRRVYGVTTATLLVIVVLGEVLAHG